MKKNPSIYLPKDLTGDSCNIFLISGELSLFPGEGQHRQTQFYFGGVLSLPGYRGMPVKAVKTAMLAGKTAATQGGGRGSAPPKPIGGGQGGSARARARWAPVQDRTMHGRWCGRGPQGGGGEPGRGCEFEDNKRN